MDNKELLDAQEKTNQKLDEIVSTFKETLSPFAEIAKELRDSAVSTRQLQSNLGLLLQEIKAISEQMQTISHKQEQILSSGLLSRNEAPPLSFNPHEGTKLAFSEVLSEMIGGLERGLGAPLEHFIYETTNQATLDRKDMIRLLEFIADKLTAMQNYNFLINPATRGTTEDATMAIQSLADLTRNKPLTEDTDEDIKNDRFGKKDVWSRGNQYRRLRIGDSFEIRNASMLGFYDDVEENKKAREKVREEARLAREQFKSTSTPIAETPVKDNSKLLLVQSLAQTNLESYVTQKNKILWKKEEGFIDGEKSIQEETIKKQLEIYKRASKMLHIPHLKDFTPAKEPLVMLPLSQGTKTAANYAKVNTSDDLFMPIDEDIQNHYPDGKKDYEDVLNFNIGGAENYFQFYTSGVLGRSLFPVFCKNDEGILTRPNKLPYAVMEFIPELRNKIASLNLAPSGDEATKIERAYLLLQVKLVALKKIYEHEATKYNLLSETKRELSNIWSTIIRYVAHLLEIGNPDFAKSVTIIDEATVTPLPNAPENASVYGTIDRPPYLALRSANEYLDLDMSLNYRGMPLDKDEQHYPDLFARFLTSFVVGVEDRSIAMRRMLLFLEGGRGTFYELHRNPDGSERLVPTTMYRQFLPGGIFYQQGPLDPSDPKGPWSTNPVDYKLVFAANYDGKLVKGLENNERERQYRVEDIEHEINSILEGVEVRDAISGDLKRFSYAKFIAEIKNEVLKTVEEIKNYERNNMSIIGALKKMK